MQPKVDPVDHPAERTLFGDALTCDALLPAGFAPGPAPLSQAPAEALLRGLAIAEDARGEEADERNELSPALQRVEAKLDLMLALLGRLASRHDDALPVRALRWSRRGLRLDQPEDARLHTGQQGTLRVQPVAWLADQLELPAKVLAVSPRGDGMQHVWLGFDTLGATLEEALDRHLFRLHRRQVAEARQSTLAGRPA